MTAHNNNLKDFNSVRGMGAEYKRQLNDIARALGNIRGENGIYVFPHYHEIVIGYSGVTFSGNGWIRGQRFTGLNATPAKPYLQITISTNPATVAEVDGPPPNPWGDDEVWRKKSDISGDLYID